MHTKLVAPAVLKELSGTKVLCHGVFDILHIGHILYFQEAKRHGDILIVSLTADEHVGKGPGRPYFSCSERIQQIAALEVVDYVIVSDSPSACGVIEAIQPQKYCKGVEYRGGDSTGNLAIEHEAVMKFGGVLVFIETPKNSSTDILFRDFVRSGSSIEALAKLRDLYPLSFIETILEKFKYLKVCVLGELIIDTYTYCCVENVSSKSPSLSGRYVSSRSFLGGIGMVIELLLEFNVKVTGLTSWSEKQIGHRNLLASVSRAEIISVVSGEQMVPEKIRFIHNDNNQRVFELMKFCEQSLDLVFNKEVYMRTQEQSDLTLVFDFGHGLVSDSARMNVLSGNDFWVNAQTNSDNYGYNLINKYSGCQNIVLDRREASLAVGKRGLKDEDLYAEIKALLGCKNLCLTLGKQGCIYDESERFPSLTSNAVDATGAGDAFYTIFALFFHLTKDKLLSAGMASIFASEKVKITGHNPRENVINFRKTLAHIFK